MMREFLQQLGENLKEMDKHVAKVEWQIKLWHRENEQSRKLEAIAGIGLITASAFVATLGDAKSLAHLFYLTSFSYRYVNPPAKIGIAMTKNIFVYSSPFM